MNEQLTIEQIQKKVDDWIKQYGVRYFSELTNMAILTEEVGELARVMARKYGDQSSKKSDEKYQLADEMADVLWVLVCLANQTGVDLNNAFLKNLDKKTERDQLRHKQNEKLYHQSSDENDRLVNNTKNKPNPITEGNNDKKA